MSWINHLNPEQKEAALHNHGPLLILAGAGSGKTSVLVARTGRLVQEQVVAPENLCVLTFTNKAARELKARVSKNLGAKASKVWAGTFHSFGLELLRRYHKEAGLPKQFGILDPGDAGSLVKECLQSFHNADKSAYDSDKLLSLITQIREGEKFKPDTVDEYELAAQWVLPKYLKQLENLAVLDFDSLILKPLWLIENHPEIRDAVISRYQQVMVDEFQDTNALQMRFVRALTQGHNNLTVVGDDDQSIYGWRGACIRNILDFPKLYTNCKVVRLERNYRSTPRILAIANSVISKNSERHCKTLIPHRPETEATTELLIYETENEEAEGIAGDVSALIQKGEAPKNIAVLFRSNTQGALIEAELRRMQIPYNLSGGTAFFDRREVRDILGYLRCASRPHEVAFRRILNTPTRGIGDKTIENLTSYAMAHHVPFFKAAQLWKEAGVDERAGHSIDGVLAFLKKLPLALTGTLGENPGQTLQRLFTEIGYKAHLEKTTSNAVSAHQRWRIVEIFGSILDRFVERHGRTEKTISAFVDSLELRDMGEEEEHNEVQLLTLHACKGLEFPIVFFAGVDEDLIPHKRLGSDVSEERRLFYVGITRAKDKLYFTRAKRRKRHGRPVDSPPSRFLLDIPKDLLQVHDGGRPVLESDRKAILAKLYAKLDGMGAQ